MADDALFEVLNEAHTIGLEDVREQINEMVSLYSTQRAQPLDLNFSMLKMRPERSQEDFKFEDFKFEVKSYQEGLKLQFKTVPFGILYGLDGERQPPTAWERILWADYSDDDGL